MKRIVAFVLLLSLAAAHGDELEGWETPPTGWKCEKGVITATVSADSSSRIVSKDKHEEPTLSFQLCVPHWNEGGAVGVYWGMRGPTGEDSYFRHSVAIYAVQAEIGRMEGEGNTTVLERLDTNTPAGKWVPISLKYRKGKLLVAVGKNRKVISLDPSHAAGYLAINPHKVSIQIRDLKIR